MIRRQKNIDAFSELFLLWETQYIALIGESGIGKTTFLQTLEKEWLFGEKKVHWINIEESYELENITEESIDREESIVIIDSNSTTSFPKIQSIIESYYPNSRGILTSIEPIEHELIRTYTLEGIGFREFAEWRGFPIEMSEIMAGKSDIEPLNDLKKEYLHTGHFPAHIEEKESAQYDFYNKCSIIESQIFKKEYETFMEYLRVLCMNTGNLFKADQLAKLMGISRRKIHKYTELLLEHQIITPIGPWIQNSITETSRHVKVYFTDLSFPASLLGDMHSEGTLKWGMIENFIFLGLKRKLGKTHNFSFYRKKSGAELSFILEEKITGKLTVIDVNPRSTDAISQALQTFDKDYHDRVDRYMLINESKAGKKDIQGIPLIIIPHIAL